MEIDREELISVIEMFLEDSGNWYNFKAHIENQGYTVQELGFEDDEEEPEKEIAICSGTVCNECPYRKEAPAGHFGGNDGRVYAAAILHDKEVPR